MMSCTVLALISDFLQLIVLGMRSHTHLAAENLFLRKPSWYSISAPDDSCTGM
jgi:hypothetical protein